MIKFEQKGNFLQTELYFKRLYRKDYTQILLKYAQAGVWALSAATPVDTGLTASSWYYTITRNGNDYAITWKNSNIVDDVSIAIILQYGHATKNGGFVQGVDYINPALRPIFDSIANEAWKEVSR